MRSCLAGALPLETSLEAMAKQVWDALSAKNKLKWDTQYLANKSTATSTEPTTTATEPTATQPATTATTTEDKENANVKPMIKLKLNQPARPPPRPPTAYA